MEVVEIEDHTVEGNNLDEVIDVTSSSPPENIAAKDIPELEISARTTGSGAVGTARRKESPEIHAVPSDPGFSRVETVIPESPSSQGSLKSRKSRAKYYAKQIDQLQSNRMLVKPRGIQLRPDELQHSLESEPPLLGTLGLALQVQVFHHLEMIRLPI